MARDGLTGGLVFLAEFAPGTVLWYLLLLALGLATGALIAWFRRRGES
jgi:hypothetical protein